MRPWKNQVVLITVAVLSISFVVFMVTGYTALYFAWLRSNLARALPYLPWARISGIVALLGAAAALGILSLPETFPITPKLRNLLSLLASATIGFFAEFRNEGKFYFKTLVHFFGPGTWIHDGLNRVAHSLGDSLYRIEYSHWNDFLMGPAIVSVLFVLAFGKIYGAFKDQGSTSLRSSTTDVSAELEHALRFARILMNVGLFWFFVQAWAEKAGYLRNPHSRDEIDLPFEFAGTMLGFWMGRVLTKPFDGKAEKFRSTFWIDFFASGVIGLLYTLIVSPLTDSVTGSIAHALYSMPGSSLDVHEYTSLQQHVRPLELLLLAGAMWWGLNRSSKNEYQLSIISNANEMADESSVYETPENISIQWDELTTMVKAFALTAAYLLILGAMLLLMAPEGLAWTMLTTATALGAATAALFLINRASKQGYVTVFGSRSPR